MIFIKTIDEQILKNAKFILNPCLEFACALGAVGKREDIFDIAREMNFTIDKSDEKLLNELEKGMSKYIRNEMEYFFGVCDIGVLVAAYVSDYEDINTVPKFLNIFDKEDVEVLFKYLGGIFIASELPRLNSDWDEVKSDIYKMKAYIEAAKVENINAKGKLLECMDNPEETKQRLSFFFKQFYEKSYLQVESIVLNEIKEAEKQYKKIMESNPEEFISKYFFNFFKIENKSWNYKLNIHLSLFLNIYFWTVSLHDYKEKQGWVVVGIRTYKIFYQKEAFEKVDRFLKVLGDKRRVDIVKMLSYKPYYGYEIAAKLELTPATVNYHINLLMDAGILTFDREENKVYYTLDKDRVKELLNETSMMLINEPLK